jgi:GNAT superfamily N-acetyltransferase
MRFEISTDASRLDRELIYRFLHHDAYWCRGISRERVEIALEHSVCFGAFHDATQVGFARVVSDYATFAYLCDVFVVASHRGRGIGKRLVMAALDHPAVYGLRRVMLATFDAHALYEEFGLGPLSRPDRWMAIELIPSAAYESGPPPAWPPLKPRPLPSQHDQSFLKPSL